MNFFTTKLLLNGKELEYNNTIQAPSHLKTDDIKQLMNSIINEENEYLIEIENIIYEEDLQMMALKCNLTTEDTIIINCTKIVNEEPELTIELPDVVISFLYLDKMLYVSCLNSKIYKYMEDKLIDQIQNEFVVKQFVDENLYLTTEDDLFYRGKVIKNISQIVASNEFIRNNNELVDFEKSIKTFEYKIFLYNKNEYLITQNKKIFFKDELIDSLNNEILLCYCYQTNSCFVTTKNIYFLNEKVEKKSNILKYTDKVAVNEEFYVLTCANKWYLFSKYNNRVIKCKKEEETIWYVYLQLDRLIVAVGKKIFFYKINS